MNLPVGSSYTRRPGWSSRSGSAQTWRARCKGQMAFAGPSAYCVTGGWAGLVAGRPAGPTTPPGSTHAWAACGLAGLTGEGKSFPLGRASLSGASHTSAVA